AIEAALAGLVGGDLDEGVVAAFLAHAQLKDAQVSAEGAGARGMARPLHLDLGKEFVGDPEHFRRDELRSEEMAHVAKCRARWRDARSGSSRPARAAGADSFPRGTGSPPPSRP